MLRKTKIVCTIGPASESVDVLQEMISRGMNVARLNFSHGSHDEHALRIQRIRQAADDAGSVVAILLDTKGPEIRTGELSLPEVSLEVGASFILTTKPVAGDQERVSISYSQLPKEVKIGGTILIDDGLIGLTVEKKTETDIYCRVQNGGLLKSRKGVNVPGVRIQLPGITEKDEADIRFGIKQNVDFIAASFVRKAEDVLEIRRILEEQGSDAQIIAKIENQEGIENIDSILQVADGIMVARGDMGVEIPVEEVPIVQKEIIRKCNQVGKPVITATQMLDSMQRNPRPTRAEASDVANAIFDGTDAIMLSGETAAGRYPLETVSTMASIARRTETELDYDELFRVRAREIDLGITDSISQAVVSTAQGLDCSAIITPTVSGRTASRVSKYRPRAPIIATTTEPSILRKLNLIWGVYPVVSEFASSTDEMFQQAINSVLASGMVAQGELVILTAGVPVGKPGNTNLMKVHVIGGVLAHGQGVGKQIITGTVVYGLTAEEINQKMFDGAIIVTRGTDKEMISSISRASAVITEEGGLTSHAAVVGVSLGIPVVVGVKRATELITDQMEITVDTKRGHVYSGRANVI
ncbi:pyruvate kinase [Seinonella peptonophila]|uniref:Pyruvate kinase n=1 Tax=Seinonella peptonophila TaxID=112248 RepID=A0A1M4W411_9BACL|nr:pyruvate kinase [Seinonella peptonophila]SHE75956.1 pyruvate kinase [Seinonella peptonophila]